MTEIKLTKRYPQSRTEDIVDAYMRGWNNALDAVQNGKFHIADHKTELKTEVKGSKRLLKGSDEPQIGCRTCIHNESGWYEKDSLSCGRCCSDNFEFYEPKTEPQTDCQWK